MTEIQMKQIVQKQLEAYNLRDINLFFACFHNEVVSERLITGMVTCRGIVQFRDIYENLFHANPLLNCELRSRIVLSNSIIDEEFITGLSNYPDGLHAVAIYGFRDGLIDRIWFPR